MTIECRIGPIMLDAAQLVDGDVNERSQSLDHYLSPGRRSISQGLQDRSEGFTVYCKNYQALQIAGLAGWKELEWIDSSDSLRSNDDIVHRGWGLLGKTNLLVYPGPFTDVELEADILSTDEDEVLLMDYVKGDYSQLLLGYDNFMKDYVVQDNFDSFDMDVWEFLYQKYFFESYNVAASGGNLVFTGKVAIGSDGGSGFVMFPAVLTPPFNVKSIINSSISYATPPTSQVTEIRMGVVVWKPENWESWKNKIVQNTVYSDDFEDGKYTGRSSPYQNWIPVTGTPAIETTSRISGSYSLRHTGNGSDDWNAAFKNSLKLQVQYPHRTDFKFKVKSQGSMANGPYLVLWGSRFQDQSNFICVETWYNGTDQLIRLRKKEGGTNTIISEVTWYGGSRAPTGTIFNFSVIDTGSNVKVYINGVKYIDTNYTTSVTTGYAFVGANGDNVGIWDEIVVRGYVVDDEIPSNSVDVRSNGYFLRSGAEIYRYNASTWKIVDFQCWTLFNFLRYVMKLDPITADDHECKIRVDENGIFTIYFDGNIIFSGPIQVPLTGGFLVGLQFSIGHQTAIASSDQYEFSMHASDFEAYMEKPFTQQIFLPPFSRSFLVPDGYRDSSVGRLPLFENPAEGVPFQTSPDDYTKGGPKFWSRNNEQKELRQVFSRDEKLVAGELEVENGIIKIVPGADFVDLLYYNSLLTRNQRGVGVDLTGLASSSTHTSTFTRDTAVFLTEGGSAKLVSTYNGLQNMAIIEGSTSRFPVTAGNEYHVWSKARLDTANPKNIQARIHWYNAGGSEISVSSGEAITSINREWVDVPELKSIAPAGAVSAYWDVQVINVENGGIFYYDSGDFYEWKEKETITLGEKITLTKILEINREIVTIQLNQTEWTLRRGEPLAMIKHPLTPLGLSLRSCYDHDDQVTTSPGSNDDISMQNRFYTLLWNKGSGSCATPSPAEPIRTMIVQTYPTTLKATSIPVSIATGIGVYAHGEDEDSPNHHTALAEAFMNRGRQKIVLP